jgi:predicted neutral ceramidase superfamily lipid hydrolase
VTDRDDVKRPDEDEKKRLDRELIELLNELRVALPGIQVLFAFLLTMPFTQRFTKITTSQRTTFFAAFICTAISSALLIAPTVLHRLRFRSRDKENVLVTSNRLTIIGTFFLAVAITAVVYLITDVLYGSPESALYTLGIASLFVLIWYLLPLGWKVREVKSEGQS